MSQPPCCQDSVWTKWCLFSLMILFHQASHVQAIPVLVLPQERTTGLGCIPEGRNVSYQCTVTDTTNPPIGSTVWGGDAFQCPSTANQIRLPHSQFNSPVPLTCGSFSARAVGVDGINYVSQLSLTAASELNGTTLFCSLSDTEEETVSDVLTIGVLPPPPGPLTVTLSSDSSLTVSWSSPFGPVEGGVGGYVFSVTGEGCGCVSMNVSGNTTSVTCSGWRAAGQTCSFEVRTLSQDCGFVSSPMNKEQLFDKVNCDPAELGDNSTLTNSSQTVSTANGVIVYNGLDVGSTAFLICNDGYTLGGESSNRSCMNNGKWSEGDQICISTQGTSNKNSQQNLGFIALISLLLMPIILFVAGLVAGLCLKSSWKETMCRVLLSVLTFGGLKVGMICREKLYNAYESKEEADNYVEESASGHEANELPYTLKFKPGPPALEAISRPVDPVVHKETAYFRGYRDKVIYKYNALRELQPWSTLPPCPVQDSSLAILPVDNGRKYILHTVGGYQEGKHIVGDLYCLDEHLATWKESSFPPMKVPRKEATTVWDNENKCLIVAGGRGKEGPSRTVEVLNFAMKTSSNQWMQVTSLPREVFLAAGCICEGYLYISGGSEYIQMSSSIEVKSVVRAKLSTLYQSKKDAFQNIADLRHARSALTCFKDQVFAICGTKPGSAAREELPTNDVYMYRPNDDLWKQVPISPSENRSYCFAVSFTEIPKPQLMVVGGYTSGHDEGCTKSVEIAELET